MAIGFTGCASMDSRYSKNRVEVDQLWAESAATQKELSFDWDEAVQYSLEHSPAMILADNNLSHAIKRREQVYKNLLPRPSLNLSYYSLFRDMGETNLSDISSVVNLFVSLPNPANFLSNLYRAEYEVRHAEYSLVLAERTTQSQLLGLYFMQAALDQKQADYDRLNQTKGQNARLTQALSDLSHELLQARSDYNAACRELLGADYRSYRFVGENIPFLDYSNFELSDPNFANTYRSMLALQMVAADLSIMGLKINDLPRFSAYLISPPLLSENDSGSNTIDFKDVGISSSLNYTPDITGRNKLSIEQAQLMKAAQIEKAKVKMANMVEGFHLVQSSVREKMKNMKQLESLIARLDDVDGARSRVDNLHSKVSELKQQLYQEQSKLWVLDDTAWQ